MQPRNRRAVLNRHAFFCPSPLSIGAPGRTGGTRTRSMPGLVCARMRSGTGSGSGRQPAAAASSIGKTLSARSEPSVGGRTNPGLVRSLAAWIGGWARRDRPAEQSRPLQNGTSGQRRGRYWAGPGAPEIFRRRRRRFRPSSHTRTAEKRAQRSGGKSRSGEHQNA